LINLFGKKSGYILVLTLVLLLSAMDITSAEEKEKAGNAGKTVRIAVVPFQAIQPQSESSNTVIGPLSGTGYFGGKIVKGAEMVTEELFVEKLQSFKEAEVIPTEKTEAVYKRISSESLKKPLLDVLKATGRELGADFVALGYVFRYTERVGYDYSAEKPASVAFEINLINSRDGKIVWRGVFDKTQKSLMEDLFQISSFYKGGGKWLTASQLTKLGIDEAFKNFSGFEH
jgi:TolB-like protein